MKPVPKCLYYIEQNDLDYYLEVSNAELNSMVYDVLQEVRHPSETRYSLKMDMENVFNEAYAQAIRMANDKHPESNFYYDYYLDVRNHVERQYEVRLILAVVYFILSVQAKQTKNIKYAISSIEHAIGTSNDYFPYFKKALDDYVHRYDDVPYDYRFQIEEDPIQTDFTMHVDYVKLGGVDWYTTTDGFEEDSIRRILWYGQTKNEKRAILNAIKESYALCEKHNSETTSDIDDLDLPF